MGRKAQATPQYSPDEKSAKLLELSRTVVEHRSEAVDARKNSGIERVWLNCEEQHLGIDDMNRHEFSDAKWAKPTSMSGPVTSSRVVNDDSRSNVFVRVTSRYVFGAGAKLSEILLPVDDKAFKIKPTPDPVLIKQLDDNSNATDPASGMPLSRPAQPGEQPPGLPPQPQAPAAPPSAPAAPGQPAPTPAAPATPPQAANGAPAQMPVTVADVAQQTIDAATDAANKAETRIYDWMTESNYPAEIRKVIHDAARCGTGVLKGPCPERRKKKAVTKSPDGVQMKIDNKVLPVGKWVDFWNIYPDDACGENIHNGSYILERDFMSEKQVKALKEQGYFSQHIDQIIEEGPGKIYSDGGNPNDKKNRQRYEIWYYYGMVKREDMEAIGAIEVGEIDQDQDDVHVMISMINDTVVRAIINPLDSGNFPYQVMTWSRRPGSWTGVGVAEQMQAAQRMVNAATRALLNNAGLSAGPQIVIDQMGMIPADGSWKLYPNKIWYKTEDSQGKSVSDAFFAAEIPNVGQQMQAVIDYAMKMAEEQTGIPLITQGQTGPSTPQTFGAAELQDNNAHTWLRSIGERFDDQITQPFVEDCYEWLLLDPNVPDDEKGDFQVDAKGSSAMVERAIQESFYIQLMPQVANKDFNLNPRKLMEQVLKSKRLGPREVLFSPEEVAQQSSQQPPPDVRVQVEQIKGQNAMQLQSAEAQAEAQEQARELQNEQALQQNGVPAPHMAAAQARITDAQIRAKTEQSVQMQKNQTDLQQAQIEAQMAHDDRQADLKMKEIERDMLILKMSMENKMTLQEVHAGLQNQAMQENTKRQLAGVEGQLNAQENDAQRTHEVNLANHSAINDHIAQQNAMNQAPPAQ